MDNIKNIQTKKALQLRNYFAFVVMIFTVLSSGADNSILIKPYISSATLTHILRSKENIIKVRDISSNINKSTFNSRFINIAYNSLEGSSAILVGSVKLFFISGFIAYLAKYLCSQNNCISKNNIWKNAVF